MCIFAAGIVSAQANKERTGIETVRIPAGTLEIGNTPKGHRLYFCDPKHNVTISKDFYMGKYEVTNAQYAEFLNSVGVGEDGMYATTNDGEQRLIKASAGEKDWGLHWEDDRWVPADGYESHPVIYVSWYGADEFARWAGGSLPTEAQWEYASRGGIEAQPFGIGDGTKLYADMANIFGTYPYDLEHDGEMSDYDGSHGHPNTNLGYPTKVGSYPYPNAFGLYDMHGNVCEWCADWYHLSYGHSEEELAGTVTDPVGPASGEERIMRGGCFRSSAVHCRSNARNYDEPSPCYANVGFRVVFENKPE